jgi:phosphoserine aminotransferase
VWSGKAMDEARRYGNVHVACSAAPAFDTTPLGASYSSAPRYVHYTSNETIYGTQWPAPPAAAPAPLVCDASSDVFSRPLPLDGHGLIYAGAQKNLGPSGISLVIADQAFLATRRADLPPLADYLTYVQDGSMHNTPNTFGIYVIGEVVAWIREQGGLAVMGERNARKAALLYDVLDHSRHWRAHAQPGSRSNMNVTFRLPSPELEQAFLKEAQAEELDGLKGHRSVGGLRASIYNACPGESVRALATFMREFQRCRG